MDSEKQNELPYKRVYTFIFCFYYLIEGIHQGLPYVYSFLLMKYQSGSYDAAMVMFIASATSIPWAFKVFIGFFNDKFHSKRYGRRFPFIFSGGSFCALWWIIFAFKLPNLSFNTPMVYSELLFYSIMTNIGSAISDTSLDGLILDVTPKDRLGKIEGYTWTMLMAGSALGGAGLGFFFLEWNILWVLFLSTGILTVVTSWMCRMIKEPPSEDKVNTKEDIKRIFAEKENYKIYGLTFADSIASPIIGTIFMYFILVTMGSISAEESIVSLISGNLPALFWEVVTIQIGNGIGVVFGCFMGGRLADQNRRKSFRLGFIVYIPMCFVCIFFKGVILGNIANAFFGFAYGVLQTSGQAIRADISKYHFPNLKSTYFGLLISLSNAGLAFGNFLGGWIILTFSTLVHDFTALTFIAMLFCAATLIIAYLIFIRIKPQYYEFKEQLKEKDLEIIKNKN